MQGTEKNAESAQHDAMRRVLEGAPSMLAYWDRDLRCCFANKAYERWFGVDAQGLIGSSLEDLLGPTLFALNETHMRAALRGEEQSFQRIVPGPDGVQRQSIAHYLPDIVDGEVHGFVMQVTDLTTLKDSETALRAEAVVRERANDLLCKSEAALRQAQRLGKIGSWHWEVVPDITTWSDELYRILGCDPTRVAPCYAEHVRLYTAKSWRALQTAVTRTLACGDPYILELEYVRPDGATGWIESRGVAERDKIGAIVALHGTAQEITARRDAREGQVGLATSEHFRDRLEALAPGVVYVFDLTRECTVYINRSVAPALGYRPEEVSAMGANVVPTLMHPNDRPRFREHLARLRLARDDETVDFEYRMCDRAGEWHWFHSCDGVFARDCAGTVSQLIGTAIEVTAQRRAEEELRASEEFNRTVLESSQDCVKVLDGEGRVKFMNANGRCLMEVDDFEAMRDQPWVNLWPQAAQPTVQAALARAIGGEVARFQAFAPTGRGTPKWWDVIVYPSRSGQVGDPKLVSVSRDISEQKQAESALRESRSFTRRVLDNLFAFVGVLMVDGTLIEVNRAPLEAAGISASDVVGKKFWDCSWWSYSPEVQARLRAACDSASAGEVVRYDVPVRIAGETTLWIDFQLAPLRDNEGRITHLIPSGMDITERRRGEQALRQNAELFVHLVDQAPTGMYVVDADFRLQQVNALAAPVFAKVDRLIGRDFAEVMEILWGPEVGADVVRHFRHTLDTGERYVSSSFSHERHDIGGEQAYEWQTQRVSLADGRYGVACYFEDVTERHRTERAVRESEERLALGTEVAELGLAEVDYSTGLNHLTARAARLFGLGDVPVALPRAEVHATFHPEDREEFERRIAECLDPAGRSWFATDLRVVWPDGQVRWLTVRKQVFFAGEGSYRRAHRAILAVRDVTDTKAVEEEVLASHARIRLAAEATAVGIWEWNVLKDTIRWDAQMFRLYGIAGTPDGYVRYSDWRGTVLPEDLLETERILQNTVQHGGQSRREFRIERRVDGEVREIEAVETVRLNERGQTEWVLGTNLDITERNRAKRKLQRSAAELETEVSLRTSELRELSVHLQTAREDEKASLARELHDELGGLLTAVKLDLARIRVKVSPDPFVVERLEHANNRLNEGIALKRRVIENLRPSALTNLGLAVSLRILCAETSAGLGIPIQAEIEEFSADPDTDLTIYRVLQESLTNISKYASANEVRVRLGTLGETVRLDVTDDGVGFDPIQSSTGKHGITGMRFRVASLGGTLMLDSAPGRGTTLVAAFPLQSITERAGLADRDGL